MKCASFTEEKSGHLGNTKILRLQITLKQGNFPVSDNTVKCDTSERESDLQIRVTVLWEFPEN